MGNTIYLVPTRTNGKKTVLEYKLIQRNRDMRVKFCKENEKNILKSIVTFANAIKIADVIVKGERIIMTSAESYYKFKKALEC